MKDFDLCLSLVYGHPNLDSNDVLEEYSHPVDTQHKPSLPDIWLNHKHESRV